MHIGNIPNYILGPSLECTTRLNLIKTAPELKLQDSNLRKLELQTKLEDVIQQ